MEDVDRLTDQCSIVASSSLTEEHVEVLKQGDTFGLFDRYGDIHSLRTGSQGLYHEGTRFLSCFELTINGERPLLLSSTVNEKNVLLNVDLMNPDMTDEGQVEVTRGALHLSRTRFLWQGLCFERLRIHNYSLLPIPVRLSISVDADFADLFEVRGTKRNRRGRRLETVTFKDGISLGYEGLDRVDRWVTVRCAPAPTTVHPGEILCDTLLPAGEVVQWELTISCDIDRRSRCALSYDRALVAVERALHSARADDCLIRTSNEQFNVWLNRSLSDLHMMVSDTPDGPYPYAGVPWFSTPFGRDGIITAFEFLWVNPTIARGVLAFLAATQARGVLRRKMQRSAKFCMKHAKEKWRHSTRFRSAAIMAASTRRRCSSCWLERIMNGQAIRRLLPRSGRILSVPCSGSIMREILMAMGSWSTAAGLKTVSFIKGGKILRMPCFMRMAVRRKDLSRSAKCKDTCLPPSGARLN